MLKQFPTFFFFWTFFYHVPVMLAFNCQQPVKITQESGTKLKKKWCFWRWGWVSGFDVDACGRDRISSFLATMATDESAGSWVFSRLKTVSHKARFKFAVFLWLLNTRQPISSRSKILPFSWWKRVCFPAIYLVSNLCFTAGTVRLLKIVTPPADWWSRPSAHL
jgi:hypothetical protein